MRCWCSSAAIRLSAIFRRASRTIVSFARTDSRTGRTLATRGFDGLRGRGELLIGFLERGGFLDARFLECRQLGRRGLGAIGEDLSGVGQLFLLRQLLDDFLGSAGGFGQGFRGIATGGDLGLSVARRPSAASACFFDAAACLATALSCSATSGISASSA